ncbi:MAG: hypothetical protein ISP86_04410 [Shewanellaceae bacterium]|nr:hypothetical protein [Shewanellaceae bacterium]
MSKQPYVYWRAVITAWLCWQIRLAGVLSFFFSCFVGFQYHLYDDYVMEVRQQRSVPAQAGMQYMDYCDGRPTAQLTSIDHPGCVADFPMDFQIKAVAALLVVLFSLLSISTLGVYLWRYRRSGS